MSGNKKLIADLDLLRSVVKLVQLCLDSGLPVPTMYRDLLADLALRTQHIKG